MDIVSLELQIFVSLVMVLGAAFVALVCDYLKGNNEQLREQNLELLVRCDEQERHALLDPLTWVEHVAASAAARTQTPAEVVGSEPGSANKLMTPAARRKELDKAEELAAALAARQAKPASEPPPVDIRDDISRRLDRKSAPSSAKLEKESQVPADVSDWDTQDALAKISDRESTAASEEEAWGALADSSAPATEDLTLDLEKELIRVAASTQAPSIGLLDQVVEASGHSPDEEPAAPEPEPVFEEGLGRVVLVETLSKVAAEGGAGETVQNAVTLVETVPEAEPAAGIGPGRLPWAAPQGDAVNAGESQGSAEEETQLSAAGMEIAEVLPPALEPVVVNSSDAEAKVEDSDSAFVEITLPAADHPDIVEARQPHLDPDPLRAFFTSFESTKQQEPAAASPAAEVEFRLDALAEAVADRVPAPEPEEQPAPVLEARPVAEPGDDLQLPTGMHESHVLTRLVESPRLMSGTVVVISITDVGRLQEIQGSQTFDELMYSVSRLMTSLLRPEDFGSRASEDEWVLIFRKDPNEPTQKRITAISERLWDFQLRSLGVASILFSWGAVDVAGELLEDALQAARDQMDQTRRGRKTVSADFARTQRKVVNA